MAEPDPAARGQFPFDRYLGQLAATLGRWDGAESHYGAALDVETGFRSPPLLTRTNYWYGRMLMERDRRATPTDVASYWDPPLRTTAERLGMARLSAQASGLSWTLR